MSSSYSSLDWVLSHWAHFSVRRFICVCVFVFCVFLSTAYLLYYCNTVRWTWWDWSLILRTYLPSVLWHCWLGHLTPKNPSPIWPVVGSFNQPTTAVVSFCKVKSLVIKAFIKNWLSYCWLIYMMQARRYLCNIFNEVHVNCSAPCGARAPSPFPPCPFTSSSFVF